MSKKTLLIECEYCGLLHLPHETHAVGRFLPEGPLGYRTSLPEDSRIFPTREEAKKAMCRHLLEELPGKNLERLRRLLHP